MYKRGGGRAYFFEGKKITFVGFIFELLLLLQKDWRKMRAALSKEI
jgi:hypothetical protein